MTKEDEIHWLLHSLNRHLHHVDDLNNEIEMWRKKYAESEFYSEKHKEIFMYLPTTCFIGRTPLQVYKDFVKDVE